MSTGATETITLSREELEALIDERVEARLKDSLSIELHKGYEYGYSVEALTAKLCWEFGEFDSDSVGIE